MPFLGLFLCMFNLKIQCVTFVYFNYLFHAIFGVPIWSNKMLILMEPCQSCLARYQHDTLGSLPPETRDVTARDSGDKQSSKYPGSKY